MSVAVATMMFATAAHAVDPYIYTGGPNYVNVSGNRCRAASPAEEPQMNYTSAGARVVQGTKTLYCPVPRRSTAFYADITPDNMSVPIDTTLTITSITVRGIDGNSSSRLSCRPFAALVGGGYSYGQTRYLCGATGGCNGGLFPPAGWTGTSSITWTNPLPTLQTLNWGISCSVPQSSGIFDYEVLVTPNV